jgi:hypothetical protein
MSDIIEGQGSIIPTIFLGMGGTGSRIVDRIAERARSLPNWESQLRPLTNFVVVDTNELDQHALRFVPPGNRINIAAFDKSRVVENYRRSQDAQALQWLDKAYQPRPGAKPGAGQIRVESRLGFFYYSARIRERLLQIVDASLRPNITWRQSKPPKYYVYLYATLAGGTGSGSFLSMSYLMQDVIADRGWQPCVIGNLMLSTLLLDVVPNELHPAIHANTYAALKELEHLNKLSYPEVNAKGRTQEEFAYWRHPSDNKVSVVQDKPFFLSFLYDRPSHIAVSNFEGAIADTSFSQLFTPLMDKVRGDYDNYEKEKVNLTRHPGELKYIGEGFTKDFGSVGTAVLRVPVRDFLDYSSLRFAAQAIRSQITFGLGPDEAQSDRARALAKLAVDYSDPKFQRMNEQAKEAEINKAFVKSVQELARQDLRDDLPDGFWAGMVESIDQGKLRSRDEDSGEEYRDESMLEVVVRKLKEARQPLVDGISIRGRPFIFQADNVNYYNQLVSKLKGDFSKAKSHINAGLEGLRRSASEGEVISDLELSPIQERYLVLRLLHQLQSETIPHAENEVKKQTARTMENPKVREKIESFYFAQLQSAAGAKKFGVLKNNDAFVAIRDEAQAYYKGVANATDVALDAQVFLAQLRSLLEYLRARAKTYSHLATHMDQLVRDLEQQAERIRLGEGGRGSEYVLQVEVLQTLTEPRTRLWREAYHRLFVAGAAQLATFDRNVLAKAIAAELKPQLGEDGRVYEKSLDQLVNDIRRALLELGKVRLGSKVMGDKFEPGLDLVAALELEARIVLEAAGQPVDTEAISTYSKRKITALSQLGGVAARLDSAESQTLDDTVTVARNRRVALIGDGKKTPPRFDGLSALLQEVLFAGIDNHEVVPGLEDPFRAVLHDVEIGVPLYYFASIIDEVEPAYMMLADDQTRAYDLHTDVHWEGGLPNLNTRKSEIAVGWSLQALVEAMATRVIQQRKSANGGREYFWKYSEKDELLLGSSFSEVLYGLSKLHRESTLQTALQNAIERARDEAEFDVDESLQKLAGALEAFINQRTIEKTFKGGSRTDYLDIPVMTAMANEARRLLGAVAPTDDEDDTGFVW